MVSSRLWKEPWLNRRWRSMIWEAPSPLWLRRPLRTKNLSRKPPEHRNWELRDLKLPLRNAMHSWGKRYEVKTAIVFGFKNVVFSTHSRIVQHLAFVFLFLCWTKGCSAGQCPFRKGLQETAKGADDQWERQACCSYRVIEKVRFVSVTHTTPSRM